jgi:hypothetical protein
MLRGAHLEVVARRAPNSTATNGNTAITIANVDNVAAIGVLQKTASEPPLQDHRLAERHLSAVAEHQREARAAQPDNRAS